MSDKQVQKTNYIIHNDDSFLIRKSEYEESKKLESVRRSLQEKYYKVSNSTVTSRVLSHWDDLNLLPQGIKKDGWREFTLVELVWLEAIQRMRDFGLPLDKIKQTKDEVLDWDKQNKRYPIFEYYISRALGSEEDPYIVITKDAAGIGSSKEIEFSKLSNGSHNMLLISLKSILENLGLKVVKPMRLFALTSDEMELLHTTRSETVDKVQLKMRNKKIVEIESSEIPVDLPANFEIEKDFKDGKTYGNVITQYEDGKRRSIQVSRKRRL